MNIGHQALLKEVYEKKGKKMAADIPGQARNMPPFMKAKGKPDEKARARQAAAKARLAQMAAKKGQK